MGKYHKCCLCGKFMKCVQESWTNVGTEKYFECKCGGYEVILEE